MLSVIIMLVIMISVVNLLKHDDYKKVLVEGLFMLTIIAIGSILYILTYELIKKIFIIDLSGTYNSISKSLYQKFHQSGNIHADR